MTYPSGLTLDFQYDANGRVAGISSGGQTLVGNVAYKPFGPAEAMDLGPLALTRTYDQRYQVTGIQAGTVLNYGYTHDGAGNVETVSGLAKPDFFPRLTDLTYTANRMATQNTDWIGAGVVLPSPAAVYSYDNAGNITSDGLHTDYFYNQNNRLIRVEIDGLTVAEYTYDAFERRVLKVVNGVTTHFHYDLNGLLISETDGNGNPRKDYVYLNGEPVAMKVYGGSAGWYWFVNDHLGTPQKMVDKSGSVVWAAAYAPFGEARVYADEITNNLRFPGQYYDVETGLHYNWHRYYDPVTGRYLTPDPIGLIAGTNLYVYVNANPTNLFDPQGLVDYDVDSQGFHVRLDTKSNITFKVNFDDKGNYVISEKLGHKLTKSQMETARKRFGDLIRDPEQQKKMRKAISKRYGSFKDKGMVGRTGRNLRRSISKIKNLGGGVLGSLGFIMMVMDLQDAQARADQHGISVWSQMIYDYYESAGYTIIYNCDHYDDLR